MTIPIHQTLISPIVLAIGLFSTAIIPECVIAQITVRSSGVISGTVQLPNKNPNFNAGTTRVDTDSQGRYFRNGVLVYSAESFNPAFVQVGNNGKYYVDFRGIPVVSVDGILTSDALQGDLKFTQRFNNDAPVKLWGNIQDELVLRGNFVGTVTDPTTGKQYQGTFDVKGQGPRYSASNGGTSPTVFDFQSQYRATDPKIPAAVTVRSYGITAVPVSLIITVPTNTGANPSGNPNGSPGGPIAPDDSGDLAGLLKGNPRFFEVNRVVLDKQNSPIGPKSRILLQ